MLGHQYCSTVKTSNSLQSLSHYRELELGQAAHAAAVDAGGLLLEYETLELRLHPPNVSVDNSSYDDRTVLIIDSANRPGTLVEVVQCLTELGLGVKQARISSDGGWFVDEFHVSETPSGRVTDPRKLAVITQVLSVPEQAASGEVGDVHTVFQIAGPEVPGMLADITQLLSHNGLEIRTAAVWTFNNRAAAVIGVTECNTAVADQVKLHRLKQLLAKLVSKNGDAAVSVEQVTGPIHHERRLHQLMLADEVHAWKQLARLQRQHSLPWPAPINTKQCGTTDTDQDTDQLPHTPKTPQQQWQCKMLPPTFMVDQQGKPVRREDVRQQQQQRDRDELALASAAGQSTTAGSASAGGLQQQCVPAFHQAALLLPLPQGLTALLPTSGAATAGGHGAGAAAAAEQASVSKLIALLQAPPLPHSTSLPVAPRGAAAAAATVATSSSEQQGSITNHGTGSAAAPDQGSATVQGKSQGQLGAAPAGPADTQASEVVASAGRAAGPGSGADSGLPPRAPGHALQSGSMSKSMLAGTAPAAAGGLSVSLSAPCSPHAHAAISHSSCVIGEGPARAALWSPGRLADAAAAAGVLSPSLHRAASDVVTPHLHLHPHPQLHGMAAAAGPGAGACGAPVAAGSCSWDSPEVIVQYSSLFHYWLVTIWCRDRNKLFFDSVCTLADLRFDIFHATIDGEPSGMAKQLFYVRPRFGDGRWDERKASLLQAMLTSAVRRRFPPGQRVHVFSGNSVCLQGLVDALRHHQLTLTRCKVRAYDTPPAVRSSGSGSEAHDASHTFYLLNRDGSLPSRQHVQMACQAAGGELVDAALDLSNPCVMSVLRRLDGCRRFAFSFVNMGARGRGGAHAAAVAGRPLGAGGAGGSGGLMLADVRAAQARGETGGQHEEAGSSGGQSYSSDANPSF